VCVVIMFFLLPRLGAIWWPCLALLEVCVCVSPFLQCSFSLPGLGPFGGPCVALLEVCVCVCVLCFSVSLRARVEAM